MEKNLILTKAKGAVLSHDFATAARLYKMLLSEDASNVEYLKQLGSIYVQNQEDEKAIPYYEQIITFYPHYIEAMNSLGAIYRRLGRYEESVAILQRAVDEGRDAASVNYNLGFTYKEMGNYKDAIDAFNLVIHENPDDVLAYNHLGRIHFDQKNYEKAIASYKRGLQIDRNHPILNYNLAHCYETVKNTGDAIRCYQSALKTRPGWVDAINDFSELLIKCQKNKEAQDLVQQSIKLHPTNADLLCLLGRVYLNQYDYSAAERTFWQADSYKSNDVKILTGLSEALEKGEKVDSALETVLGALEIEPENKDIRKQYVHTLLTAKDYDSALANVKALYDETEGKDLSVLDLYGQYYICKDQEEQAQEYYNKIQVQNHHYKDYMLGAANRFSQIGKYDKAESYANEFIEKRPSNPEGYNVLGKIFENKGDLQKAIESYNKSLNLRKPNVMADKKIAAFKKELTNQAIPVEESENNIIPEEQPAVIEAPVNETEEETTEEEFDYSLMGGNVPLQEGLVEEEKDFFDSLDEDKEDFPEEEEPEKEEDSEEEEQPKFKYNAGNPADVFDDDGIFDDDAAQKENDSLENGLKDATEKSNEEDNSLNDLSNLSDDDEADAFDIFGDEDSYKPKEEKIPEPESAPEPKPAPAQAPRAEEPAPYQPPVQPAYNPQQDEFERRMQQMAMDNAAHAMEAAFAAQKMAQQLADQQKLMQEQTQQALKDALDKVQNMQEERMKEQDREIESLLDDENIVDETQEIPAVEIPEEEVPVEEVAAEEAPVEDEVSEDVSLDDILLEDEIVETPIEDESEEAGEETAVEEMESDSFNVELNEVADEADTEVAADVETEVAVEDEFVEIESEEAEIPEDDFNLDLGCENTDEISEEQQDILTEELLMEGSVEDGEEVLFATVDDLIQDFGEEIFEETAVNTDVPVEVIYENPIEEDFVEDQFVEEEKESSVDEMLAKIERILSDDEMAKEYGPELELFKKLKVLSDYLPDSEKNTFLSCRMRMLIEYIISKMSGKPGLLSTAIALLKSGVLGSEYTEKLEEDFDSDGEVRNELIRVVLMDMKNLTYQLQDRTLADAMIASVDNILERIEIEDQKSKIF